MAAKTNAREEAVRQAREDASVVLAKHPCVTAGVEERCEERPGPADLRHESDRGRIGHEGHNLGGTQDPAGADDSK